MLFVTSHSKEIAALKLEVEELQAELEGVYGKEHGARVTKRSASVTTASAGRKDRCVRQHIKQVSSMKC